MHRRYLFPALVSSLFALVAGVAGWLWYDLFSNALVGLAAPGFAASTAACAAVAGAVAGLLLAPSPAVDGLPPHPSPARITAVVLAGGALAGGAAALVHDPGVLGLGLAAGFVCALPLIPAAALVLPLLRRAGRARPGSLLSRADARALVLLLAGLLGLGTALALLDWPAAALGAEPPSAPIVLLIIAAALVTGLLLIDFAVLSRVERWALDIALADEALPLLPSLPSGRVDIGLGEQIAASALPGTAYRGGGRTQACLLGDIDEALATLRQSVRRGAVLLALIEAIGIAHGLSRGAGAAAQYEAWRCDDGELAACRSAALLAEGAGLPDREAARLHGAACAQGNEDSCLALTLMQMRSRITP